MNSRSFLQDIIIWGAMLVARCGGILHYSIPCLLKYCDKVLLMQDNIDEKTKTIVDDYKKKYPDIIELAETGFPPATPVQEKDPRGLFHRFKPLQGKIREKVFDYIKNKKIDILIFPDSDEMFSNNLPNLLQKFWSMSEIKGVTCKCVDVFGDFYTIHSRSMTGHTRLLKPFDGLSALPYRTACYYNGLTKQNRIGDNRTLIHLAALNQEKRNWRAQHWKPNCKGSEALWKLSKDVREMTPEEIKEVLKREPDLTVEEYLRGGDKRSPVGINNAANALKEATDILDKLEVKYYLGFGTALGLYRDRELIKWDWDLDILILAENNHKLEKGREIILKAGFTEFKRKQDIPKWIKEDGTKSEEKYVRTYSFKKYGVRIDLDPAYLSQDGESRIILKGRKRQMFCGKHPAEWFNNYGGVDYRGKFYRIPSPIEDYLVSNYGSSWKTPVYGPMRWEKRPCFSKYYECK